MSGLISLSRSAGETECLYHNSSQQVQIYNGPADIEL